MSDLHTGSRCGDSLTRQPDPFAVEPTAIGLQSLVPGVAPILPLDRLLARAAARLEPKKPQRPCDLGLFDINACNPLDLFAPPVTATPESDA